MQMINGAPLAANGRVAVTASNGIAPAVTFNAAFGYEANGSLSVIETNPEITSWNSGLSFYQGHLRVKDIQGNAPVIGGWNFGLPMSLSNELICTSTAPIARYVHGWPVAANGAVCIVEGAPVVNAFTNGFDTGYD